MGGDEVMIVIAGIGCRAACPEADIVALVQEATALAGTAATALAAPAFKAGEPGLRAAADRLGLPLILVTADQLEAAQPRCVTHSEATARAAGVGSVAEGSALAAAGPGGRLLLPRIASASATCALAEAAP